jgi:glycosyltransferase involved in cell wall biosynthesis
MKIMIASRGIDNIAGGVEHMSAALMNEMVRRGHDVALMTWDKPDARSFFPLDEKIVWHKIGLGDFLKKATLSTRLQRARAVRRIVRAFKPDVIVGFQDGMFMASRLYTAGMGVPVVAAERNAPSRFDFIRNGRYRHLVFQAMRFAKAITIQCESYRSDYPPYLRSKIVTIPNPVKPVQAFADPCGKPGAPKTLLSVGRLSYQKNMDALIAAFASLSGRFPDWNLLIVGEGEDRPKLEQAIRAHGLQARIRLPGASASMTDHFKDAQLFCLPSRWEGFPNALAEAMAHGLPAAGFAGCAGVNELIEHGVTGMLAAGPLTGASLESSLAALMQDDAARKRMGDAGRSIADNFAPSTIFDKWEHFFLHVKNSSGPAQ